MKTSPYFASLFGYVSFGLLGLSLLCGVSQAADGPVSLKSQRAAGQSDKVTVLLEAGGDFLEKAKANEPSERVPMTGVSRLTYHEKTYVVGDAPRSLRYYEKAEASVKFKDGGHNPALADERKLVAAAVNPPDVVLYALGEPLRREELEVIDVSGNSLVLDALLPANAVSVNDTWEVPKDVAAALLDLDSASQVHLNCKLTEVTEAVARIELEGKVEGMTADAKTRIELKGKYRFDRKTNRIDWFALAMREHRGTSRVADGFDVNVRLQVSVTPEATPPELSDASLAKLDLEPSPEKRLLGHHSPQGQWQITYPREWYLNSDNPDRTVLRLIRDEKLTAQCNVSSLRQKTPEELVTLEQFQDDVRQALGDNFGELVESKEMSDSIGRRILRVVVNGVAREKSTEVPIRWIYYHISTKDGRQAALAFTVEQDLLEKFADADRPILDSLQFSDPSATAAEAETAEKQAGRQEAKGRG